MDQSTRWLSLVVLGTEEMAQLQDLDDTDTLEMPRKRERTEIDMRPANKLANLRITGFHQLRYLTLSKIHVR